MLFRRTVSARLATFNNRFVDARFFTNDHRDLLHAQFEATTFDEIIHQLDVVAEECVMSAILGFDKRVVVRLAQQIVKVMGKILSIRLVRSIFFERIRFLLLKEIVAGDTLLVRTQMLSEQAVLD